MSQKYIASFSFVTIDTLKVVPCELLLSNSPGNGYNFSVGLS